MFLQVLQAGPPTSSDYFVEELPHQDHRQGERDHPELEEPRDEDEADQEGRALGWVFPTDYAAAETIYRNIPVALARVAIPLPHFFSSCCNVHFLDESLEPSSVSDEDGVSECSFRFVIILLHPWLDHSHSRSDPSRYKSEPY